MSDQIDYDTVTRESFIIKGRISAPDIYADGLSQLIMFGTTAKIVLHSVVLPKSAENPEIRKAIQTLSMPIVHALELADFILRAAKNSQDRITEDLGGDQLLKVQNILSQISDESPPNKEPQLVSPKKKKK